MTCSRMFTTIFQQSFDHIDSLKALKNDTVGYYRVNPVLSKNVLTLGNPIK